MPNDDTRQAAREPKRRAPLGARWMFAILILAFLFVLMPFLFWNATWFGRPMSDAQISQALVERSHPREIQHALTQIESRMEARDPGVIRWYPQVLALASDPMDEIRVTDAWVMGQDNKNPGFRDALIKLLNDRNPMVQRNAALSLVRFDDDSGHGQIVDMLRPYGIEAPLAGRIETRLKPGDTVNPGTLLAHIDVGGQSREVRSQVPGTVENWLVPDGSTVSAGQRIALLAPSESMVWEALRALYLVGHVADLPDIQRFARGADGMSSQIAQQAQYTSAAIRARSTSSP
ncbi:MAG TPA: HEAT repeat domain-containing protein [Candidatus Cybelea sp.]|nr:HEAT repeat domain-containing protein [Candidatus Cybelea sp.]